LVTPFLLLLGLSSVRVIRPAPRCHTCGTEQTDAVPRPRRPVLVLEETDGRPSVRGEIAGLPIGLSDFEGLTPRARHGLLIQVHPRGGAASGSAANLREQYETRHDNAHRHLFCSMRSASALGLPSTPAYGLTCRAQADS